MIFKMCPGVRKKVLWSLCVLSVQLIIFVVASDSTVVMKINSENRHADLQPRTLISHYNIDMKEKNLEESNETRDDIERNYGNILKNESSSKLNNNETLFQQPIFPYNLQVVHDVLKKLKNKDCVRDTLLVLNGLLSQESWALEMFDSFPKFPMGILYGNFYQLGNFDECVDAKHVLILNGTEETKLQGQYCLADIHLRNKNSKGRVARHAKSENAEIKINRYKFNRTVIHWGICIPSSCTTYDTQIFVQEIFTSVVQNFEIASVRVDTDKCYFEKPLPFTLLEIIYASVIGLFFTFTIFATGYHCWYLRQRKRYIAYSVDSLRAEKPSLLKELLLCFSVIHTTRKFLQTKPNDLNLECICGIKFLSMSLIIAGHSLIFIMGGPIINSIFFQEMSTKLENGPLVNNALLVDTFLFVSGFLLCRLLLTELEKRNGKINFLVLYIARYIRLTPAYMVVIGLYATFLYRTGSGPFWDSKISLEKERCLKSWWTNILYINNYINTDNLCMFQSWYLAVDYHLFIVAPCLIYPLWKKPKIGKWLLTIFTFSSIAVPFWLTYVNNLDPTLMAYPPEVVDLSKNFYFINVYIKTHMRSSSYWIGLFFGYILHKLQTTGTKICSYINWLGWILAACLGITSMYSIVIFYSLGHLQNNFESAVYASLHRVAWCLSIGWVLIACATDNAAIITKFLSSKLFVPASRLTYCAYLTNGIIEIYNMGVLRQPMYLNKYELACKILGHLVLTYTLAFLLCILFESPIHALEKLLLSKEKVWRQKQNSTLRPVQQT